MRQLLQLQQKFDELANVSQISTVPVDLQSTSIGIGRVHSNFLLSNPRSGNDRAYWAKLQPHLPNKGNTWCTPGSVVGVFEDGVGPPSVDALFLAVCAAEPDTLGSIPYPPDYFTTQQPTPSFDSHFVAIAVVGEVPVRLTEESDLSKFRSGSSSEYLCVDQSGSVRIWDRVSKGVRVFALALRQHTHFDAEGYPEVFQGVKGIRSLVSHQVECSALRIEQSLKMSPSTAIELITPASLAESNKPTQSIQSSPVVSPFDHNGRQPSPSELSSNPLVPRDGNSPLSSGGSFVVSSPGGPGGLASIGDGPPGLSIVRDYESPPLLPLQATSSQAREQQQQQQQQQQAMSLSLLPHPQSLSQAESQYPSQPQSQFPRNLPSQISSVPAFGAEIELFNIGRDESAMPPWIRGMFDQSNKLLSSILPSALAVHDCNTTFRFARDVVGAALGIQLFPTGNLVSGTFLPGEGLEATAFTVLATDELWYIKVNFLMHATCPNSFSPKFSLISNFTVQGSESGDFIPF